jgi:site-specific recombinase XerD
MTITTITAAVQAAYAAPCPTTSKSSRTVPIPDTLQSVPGYPDKLKIYRIAASCFWQVRCYEQTTGKTVKRSTGQTDKREAIKFAKHLYEQLVFNRLNGVAMTKKSRFDACANGMMEMQAARVARKEISAAAHRNDQYFLDAKILPELRELDVAEITYDTLERFIGKIGSDLSASSIQRYLGVIRKVLDYALNRNLMQVLPKFPKVKKQDAPRGWFSAAEYQTLRKHAKELIGSEFTIRDNPKAGQTEGNVVRKIRITADLHDMIAFMVNSFIRPTDLKNMQHKHVEIVKGEYTYLRLTLPTSKGKDKPIATMKKAVDVYEKLTARHNDDSLAEPDDYVFLPEYTNRDTALRRLQQQFNYLLDTCGFKQGPRGEERTIYSLRHTCIMYRLCFGEGIDLLTLARNARTSVEMIDRFYASELTGEMNIDSLQSMRRKRQPVAWSPLARITPQSGSIELDLPTSSPPQLDLE